MKVRMKARTLDVESVVVEGKIQYAVKNGVVEVEEPHAATLRAMGFTEMTSEDDRVMARDEYLAKNGEALYSAYLVSMRGRLGDKFVMPPAPASDPLPESAQGNGKGQVPAKAQARA